MELVQKTSWAKEVVKALAITAVLALSYYIITMSTPAISFTFGSQIGLRIANGLRALALATPLGALAVSVGSTYVDVHSGRIALGGIYWALGPIHLAAGLLAYKLASIGRFSHFKNLFILAGFGGIMGLVVALNHTLVKAPVLFSPKFMSIFLAIVLSKVIGEVIGTLTGYPLFLIYKGIRKKR